MRPDPNFTLPRKLLYWAEHLPHEIALRQKDYGIWEPHSWAEYERCARHFGLGLAKLGLGGGGHAAIISENRKEWVYAQLGHGMLGAVTVGVYPTSPAAEAYAALAKEVASSVAMTEVSS